MMYSTRKELIEGVMDVHNKNPMRLAERLYSCKAWIIKSGNSDFIILRSYSSIVAAFQRSTGILWVFGFYSNTTAHHVSKFWNLIQYRYQAGSNHPHIVKLYNDSKTGKRAARKNLEDDFASVIATALNQH